MLLLSTDEEGSGGMTDRQVRDEAITLFLAGHETTATALTWTWYLLSQNPDVEQRLRTEIKEVLGGRLPTYADLPNLRYTEMVLAESLRLYPPAWGIGRMAKTDTRIYNYAVPKNSICLVSPYVMHRHPRYYPDPERFDPCVYPGGEAGSSEVRVLPVWRWDARMHRRAIRVDGRRVSHGDDRTALAIRSGSRYKVIARTRKFTLRTRYGMKMVVRPAE